MAGYLERLVERATGARPAAPVLSRAPRPDAIADDPFEREELQLATPARTLPSTGRAEPSGAPTHAATTTTMVVDRERTVVQPQQATVVEASTHLSIPGAPPVAIALPAVAAPAEQLPILVAPRVDAPVLQAAAPLESGERAEPPAIERETIVRHRVPADGPAPLAIPLPPPAPLAPLTPPILPAAAARDAPSPVPPPIVAPALQPIPRQVARPAVDPAPPRIVIGRVTIEIVPPAPAQAPARTVVVHQPSSPVRADILRRGFGLGQE